MKKTIMFFGLLAILTACTSTVAKDETVATDSVAVAVDTTCVDSVCVATPTVAIDTTK